MCQVRQVSIEDDIHPEQEGWKVGFEARQPGAPGVLAAYGKLVWQDRSERWVLDNAWGARSLGNTADACRRRGRGERGRRATYAICALLAKNPVLNASTEGRVQQVATI